MRFGIVLPTWPYNSYRRDLALRTFDSLSRTAPALDPLPILYIIEKPSVVPAYNLEALTSFQTCVEPEPDMVYGTEQTLAYGTEQVLDKYPTVTHVVWMGDDALFYPGWLHALRALIDRHPQARAWSVYRSAHVRYHATIALMDADVLVKSLCGHGMTFSREEWAAWGIDWRAGRRWITPTGGETLDLNHPYARPGERWTTQRSYVEHTGETGVNCKPGIPEYAQAFMGEK